MNEKLIFMKLFKLKPLYLFLIVVGGLTALFGCPVDEPSEPDDKSEETEESYVSEDDVKLEHKVGVTQCPQKAPAIEVSCSDDGTSECTGDSASIECSHPAIDCRFGNLENSSVLLPSEPALVFIEFNCSQTESFNTTAECKIYNDGELVETEEIAIAVDISQ